jgi:hypothetical protein
VVLGAQDGRPRDPAAEEAQQQAQPETLLELAGRPTHDREGGGEVGAPVDEAPDPSKPGQLLVRIENEPRQDDRD